ncbi:MAG TPA: hypothetical protein VNM47_03715, partial [Terriglobia bacterium]|nr:hypothetical protein [Terriglobia bacterium]
MNHIRGERIALYTLCAILLHMTVLAGQVSAQQAADPLPVCAPQSLPSLPDVRITSVTPETAPVAHCKVAGVIGSEIHFELLLPEKWNGKFVMGGGGGFVGSVMNTSLMFGS